MQEGILGATTRLLWASRRTRRQEKLNVDIREDGIRGQKR